MADRTLTRSVRATVKTRPAPPPGHPVHPPDNPAWSRDCPELAATRTPGPDSRAGEATGGSFA